MKVVYNTCFGGFSISRECAEWMADHGNKECIAMLAEELADELEFYGGLDNTPRHDAILVLAVEHLGTKRASGSHAALEVYELEDTRYYIDEYDGTETVVEP
ncbi:MAG TPA: hypothetical protein EYQ00_02510, partial [Dehalococcoidia bacterium]|nr:hypothetical protein [Dehalococcoidia bacterium]